MSLFGNTTQQIPSSATSDTRTGTERAFTESTITRCDV